MLSNSRFHCQIKVINLEEAFDGAAAGVLVRGDGLRHNLYLLSAHE